MGKREREREREMRRRKWDTISLIPLVYSNKRKRIDKKKVASFSLLVILRKPTVLQ